MSTFSKKVVSELVWDCGARDEEQYVIDFASGDADKEPATCTFANSHQREGMSFLYQVLPSCSCGQPSFEEVILCQSGDDMISMCKAANSGNTEMWNAATKFGIEAEQRDAVEEQGYVGKTSVYEWKEVLLSVAADVTLCRVKQDSLMRKQLLATGDALLAYANERDCEWGTWCAKGTVAARNVEDWGGANVLGWALMCARAVAYNWDNVLTELKTRHTKPLVTRKRMLDMVWWHQCDVAKPVVIDFVSHKEHKEPRTHSFSNFSQLAGMRYVYQVLPACWGEEAIFRDVIECSCSEEMIMLSKAAFFNDVGVFRAVVANGASTEAPIATKRLGRGITAFNKLRWQKILLEVAIDVVMCKAKQDARMRQQLLETGDALLAEANEDDSIWGIACSKGSEEARDAEHWRGANVLGWALMCTRNVVRNWGAVLVELELSSMTPLGV